MDGIESSITEQSSDVDTRLIALEIINQIQDLIFGLLRPWNAYQVAIALVLFLVATLLSSALKKRLRSLMEVRDGWPIWRMRFMVVFEERLRLLLFVILIYFVIAVMREVTWPSRSYFLSVIGQISLIWYTIAILTRLIANLLARKAVSYLGWTWGNTGETNTIILNVIYDPV